MNFIFILILQLISQSSAEIVDPDINAETQMDRRYRPTYTWRGAPQITASIRSEVNYLRRLKENGGRRGHGQGKDYAYINKKTRYGGFATYLVHLDSGRVIDTFPSLIGYNGMGCGKGQTRPGVTLLTSNVGKGASRKAWWGNNWKLYDIEPIAGITPCRINSQIVTHSNVNLSGKDLNDRITSHSSGCFTVPPDRLRQMSRYAGNAYIYNVPTQVR